MSPPPASNTSSPASLSLQYHQSDGAGAQGSSASPAADCVNVNVKTQNADSMILDDADQRQSGDEGASDNDDDVAETVNRNGKRKRPISVSYVHYFFMHLLITRPLFSCPPFFFHPFFSSFFSEVFCPTLRTFMVLNPPPLFFSFFLSRPQLTHITLAAIPVCGCCTPCLSPRQFSPDSNLYPLASLTLFWSWFL
jgi:hypothetical protein